jgi:hypothetical protein
LQTNATVGKQSIRIVSDVEEHLWDLIVFEDLAKGASFWARAFSVEGFFAKHGNVNDPSVVQRSNHELKQRKCAVATEGITLTVAEEFKFMLLDGLHDFHELH